MRRTVNFLVDRKLKEMAKKQKAAEKGEENNSRTLRKLKAMIS